VQQRHHDPSEGWGAGLIDRARGRTEPLATDTPPVRGARRARTWALAGCVAGLLLGTPVAVQAVGEGEPILGGARNPSPNETLEYAQETEILAETARDTYGTRQSNKGEGGGAIYGCRSELNTQSFRNLGDPAFSTPCLRANNLDTGKAFDLQVGEGNLGGVIQKTNDITTPFPNAVPFITNMGGVALGLNADRVDNLHAEQIIQEAVDRAGDGDGETPPEGTVPAGGGFLEVEARGAADYAEASRTCAEAGRRLAPANVLLAAAAADEIDLGNGEISSDVTTVLPIDLNEPLSPLLQAIDDALLGVFDAPQLDPATATGSYTRVDDGGSLAASNLSATNPYRCFVG